MIKNLQMYFNVFSSNSDVGMVRGESGVMGVDNFPDVSVFELGFRFFSPDEDSVQLFLEIKSELLSVGF